MRNKKSGIVVKSFRNVGVDGRHLFVSLWDGIKEISSIAYNQGNIINGLSIGIKIDIICIMEVNSWNGIKKVQLNIRDTKIRE